MLTEMEPTLGVCQETTGPWLDEPMAMAALDGLLDTVKLFQVYREVIGERNQPRLNSGDKSQLKIDRILIPNARLIDAGWCYGAIGIEGKQPGNKLGPVVCQCLDYGRAVWHLRPTDENPRASGQWVMCPWTFIWHLPNFAGDIASVMAQHRIGGVSTSNYYTLNFKHAGGSILNIDKTGKIQFREARCGMKAGSR